MNDETLHRFTLSNGAEVWSIGCGSDTTIRITWETPAAGLTLTLVDAAMLSRLANDIYSGRVRRIDRPRESPSES